MVCECGKQVSLHSDERLKRFFERHQLCPACYARHWRKRNKERYSIQNKERRQEFTESIDDSTILDIFLEAFNCSPVQLGYYYFVLRLEKAMFVLRLEKALQNALRREKDYQKVEL